MFFIKHLHCFSSNIFIVFFKKCSLISSKSFIVFHQNVFIVFGVFINHGEKVFMVFSRKWWKCSRIIHCFSSYSSKKMFNYEKKTSHFLRQAPPILLLFSMRSFFCRKFRKVICCSSVNSSEFFYDHFSLQRSEFNIIPLLNVIKQRGVQSILSVAMLRDSRRTPMSWLSYTILLCETSYSYIQRPYHKYKDGGAWLQKWPHQNVLHRASNYQSRAHRL